MSVYTTVLGDTFDSIAKKQYGSEKYTKELMEANTQYLTTVIFSDGVILKIPEINEEVNEQSSNLPPWRR